MSDVNKSEQVMMFQPFICQQVLPQDDGRVWLGFVFICEAEGELKMQNGETKDPRWVSIEELEELVYNHPEKIFPHQCQALKYYLDSVKLVD